MGKSAFSRLAVMESAKKDLVVGSIAGLFGRLLEHPFDSIKVRLQTSTSFQGVWDCVGKTVRKEGVQGLYKGLSVPLMGSVAENAVIFASYRFYQNTIQTALGVDKLTFVLISYG